MAARPTSRRSQATSRRRFRARIRLLGLNPHVDVPGSVSRAFAAYARAGRIRYEGKLEGTPIRGTLIPARRGRHRLFVNGGMRNAAGVEVGRVATFEVRATAPDVVRPPADVAAVLRRERGAAAAFDALSPSHRHELLRYVDDARTPETRGRRIDQLVRQVLGRHTPPERRGSERPLWTCPRCGNAFVNRNQYHACRRLLNERLGVEPSAETRALYRSLL